MSKYFIEDVRWGITEGGIACGPVPGNVVVEAKIRDDETGKEFYVANTEVEGLYNLFQSDESTFERQMEDTDDEAFWDWLNENLIEGGDYEDFFADHEDDDSEDYQLYRYLICITRAEEDEADAYIAKTKGNYLSEIEIPKCDIEKEMEEESEETDEND